MLIFASVANLTGSPCKKKAYLNKLLELNRIVGAVHDALILADILTKLNTSEIYLVEIQGTELTGGQPAGPGRHWRQSRF